MADDENVTTKLQVDVTDFKKGLADANRYIRLANSEFEKATAGAGKFSDSTDGLRAKLTQLEKTLEGQEAAASVLRAEYERVCEEQGENSKGAQELAIKLNKQEAACKKTASQIAHYKGSLDDMEAAAKDAGKAVEKFGKADGENEDFIKSVDDQRQQLKDLKNQYINVAAAQGDTSDEAQALEKEISDLAKTVKENEELLEKLGITAGKAAGEIDDTKKSADKAGNSIGGFVKKLAAAAGKGIATGLKGLTTAAAGLATAFLATGETSKEWIGNMNKLDAVAKDTGRSTEAVKAQFTEFYGILGDETAATTTASNLEAVGLSQENLASVTNSMAGIWSKYGDSIPLDGLAESINETSKAGQITGNLADALNWAGISEDQFNEKLAACSSEQERQQLIVDTLDGAYGKLGETYKEQNKAVIDSNKANAALQDSLAGVGAVAMPVMSTLKMLGASMLNDLLPGVKDLGKAFNGLLNGEAGSAEKVGSALSGLLTTAINKIVKMAPVIIQAGISLIGSLVSSFTSMAPTLATTAVQLITDVCVALIGMIPQLVTLGIDLILGLLQGLTSAIPQVVQACVDMLPLLCESLISGIPLLIQAAVDLFLAICQAVPVLIDALVPQIPTIVMAIVNGLLDNLGELLKGAITLLLAICQAVPVLIKTLVPLIPGIVEQVVTTLIDNLPVLLRGAIDLFMALVKAIPTICLELAKATPSIVKAILKGLAALPGQLGSLFTDAWNGIKKIFSLSAVKGHFSSLLNGIKNVFSSIGAWFSGIFSDAWRGIKNAFSSVGEFFSGIFDDIKGIFTNIGDEIGGAVSGAFKSAVNWVLSKAIGIINGFISAINSAIGIINKIPGVSIKKIKKLDVPEMYDGGILKKGQIGLLEGKGDEAVVPLHNNRKWIRRVAAEFRNQLAGAAAGVSGAGGAARGGANVTYVFNQYNNSPKALSRAEIYRQTKNQLHFATQT